MKKILLPFLFLCSIASFAQQADTTHYWTKGGVGSLTFNQITFANWAAGGESALSGSAFLNVFSKYKKGSTTWDNNLDLAYGIIKTDTNKIHKNDDKIDFSSKFGHLAITKWYYTALVNFKSQFSKSYKYPDDSTIVSNWLAPGYLLLSLGMDYKPNDDFSFYASPATGKITFVHNPKLQDAGAYGVDKAEYDASGVKTKRGKSYRAEFGAYMTMKYRRNLMENITMQTKLDLFSNYSNHPENIDINWDVMIAMKVNKYITASLNTSLIYDDDVKIAQYETIAGVRTITGSGPRTQFKEAFGVGLSYKF